MVLVGVHGNRPIRGQVVEVWGALQGLMATHGQVVEVWDALQGLTEKRRQDLRPLYA